MNEAYLSVKTGPNLFNSSRVLKKTEENYRHFFENAIDGMFRINRFGRIVSANPAMARIFGYESPQELLRFIKNIGEQIYVDIDRYNTLKQLLKKQDAVHDFEFQAIDKAGGKIWVCQNVRAVRNEAGHLLYYEGTIRDISLRKELEEQLIQSQKMEAIGRLAGGIAHDFNNILTTMMGNAELALRQLVPRDPVHKRVGIILETAKWAAQLTRQLLTISRKQVVKPVVFDVNCAVENVGKILERLLGEDVQCDLTLGENIRSIRADASQIEQLILNLAVNARDAMPDGGKLTVITAMVHLDQDYCRNRPDIVSGDYVMLSVSDTGTGISGSSMEHIFEPFYTTKTTGNGLGLSIVYGIVKQCGGHIEAVSTVGVGSTFKVYLPCVAETEKPPENPTSSPEDFLPGGKETILIVEDEDYIRELIGDVLCECGYTVHLAATAEEALVRFDGVGGGADLVVTDVILPGMRGPELAAEMKARFSDIKVVFMSGYMDHRIRHSEIWKGKAHFLPKPFTPAILVQKIRDVLAGDEMSICDD